MTKDIFNDVFQDRLKDLFDKIKCAQCGNKIPEGGICYKHPIHGIVCEHCPAFSDGGVVVEDPTTDD